MWTLFDSGLASPEENMALDSRILAKNKGKTLHFYRWKGKSLTYGHFAKIDKLLEISALSEYGFSSAKRPTGGGVIFHLTDFAFSLFIPADDPLYSDNTLENYRLVNGLVQEAISLYLGKVSPSKLLQKGEKSGVDAANHFCMAHPTIYDVIFEGKKVGGAAQRKTKRGFLHQGTLSLALPDFDLLSKIILESDKVLPLMKKTTFSLIPGKITQEELERERDRMQACLTKVIAGECPP